MKTPFEDENLARCLAARRRIERRHKTTAGLCEFLSRLEDGPFPTPAIRRIAAKARLRPIRASATPFGHDEMLQRCRGAREALDKRFKTADEVYAWLLDLEKGDSAQRGVRSGKARAHRKARPVAHNGKPAHGKLAHKL